MKNNGTFYRRLSKLVVSVEELEVLIASIDGCPKDERRGTPRDERLRPMGLACVMFIGDKSSDPDATATEQYICQTVYSTFPWNMGGHLHLCDVVSLMEEVVVDYLPSVTKSSL